MCWWPRLRFQRWRWSKFRWVLRTFCALATFIMRIQPCKWFWTGCKTNNTDNVETICRVICYIHRLIGIYISIYIYSHKYINGLNGWTNDSDTKPAILGIECSWNALMFRIYGHFTERKRIYPSPYPKDHRPIKPGRMMTCDNIPQ